MKEFHLKTTDDFSKLRLGDAVYLTGTIITARDMAHKRISEIVSAKKKPPFAINGGIIFHAGPIVKLKRAKGTKGKKKFELVAIGSTTSSRMNKFNSLVSSLGAKAIIGKGGMPGVRELKDVVYLAFTGGCAALGAKMLKIKSVEWHDLGDAEAVWVLEAKEFGPLIVAMRNGKTLYK